MEKLERDIDGTERLLRRLERCRVALTPPKPRRVGGHHRDRSSELPVLFCGFMRLVPFDDQEAQESDEEDDFAMDYRVIDTMFGDDWQLAQESSWTGSFIQLVSRAMVRRLCLPLRHGG